MTVSVSITVTTYFKECIISLVVALDSKGGSTWTTCTNTQFHHLVVKASGIILTDAGCDIANVQASRLPRQRRVGAYTHANCLDRESAVNTSDRGARVRSVPKRFKSYTKVKFHGRTKPLAISLFRLHAGLLLVSGCTGIRSRAVASALRKGHVLVHHSGIGDIVSGVLETALRA